MTVDSTKVWNEFIQVSGQIFEKIQACEKCLPLEHVKKDVKEFKELDAHIEEADSIVKDMINEDAKVLEKE